MKIATYVRVSTDMQKVDPQTLELKAWCAAKGWKVAAADRFEDVMSGAKRERPGLEELLAAVRKRKFDAVCCVKLDRMARSMRHFAEIVEIFERADVALIFTSQGIDTSKSNACGRLQLAVLSAVAAFERDLIRERTRAGLAVARENGKVLGHRSERMGSDEERAAIVAQWQKETGGVDFRMLAERLGGVSAATAWRVVKKLEENSMEPNGEKA